MIRSVPSASVSMRSSARRGGRRDPRSGARGARGGGFDGGGGSGDRGGAAARSLASHAKEGGCEMKWIIRRKVGWRVAIRR